MYGIEQFASGVVGALIGLLIGVTLGIAVWGFGRWRRRKRGRTPSRVSAIEGRRT
jgi:hypothetical protein